MEHAMVEDALVLNDANMVEYEVTHMREDELC